MNEIFKSLNERRESLVHLSLFWRLILFFIIPIMPIWFILQLIMFSGLGTILYFLACMNILFTLPYKDKGEDKIESLGFIFLPVYAPILWLYKYFVLGEFATLFD